MKKFKSTSELFISNVLANEGTIHIPYESGRKKFKEERSRNERDDEHKSPFLEGNFNKKLFDNHDNYSYFGPLSQPNLEDPVDLSPAKEDLELLKFA
jgi:hypothetical protein